MKLALVSCKETGNGAAIVVDVDGALVEVTIPKQQVGPAFMNVLEHVSTTLAAVFWTINGASAPPPPVSLPEPEVQETKHVTPSKLPPARRKGSDE